MAKLVLNVEDILLSRVLPAALNRGQTLDAYVTEALKAMIENATVPPVNSDLGGLLAQLLERATAIKPDKQFYLDEICTPDEWNALSNGARKSLGKEFRKAVENPQSPIAHHVGRTSSNKAIYQRIKENV
jgi:hypothetical protein